MTQTRTIRVGDRITAGEGDDRDSGVVDEIIGDRVTVRWDSGVVTTQRAVALGVSVARGRNGDVVLER